MMAMTVLISSFNSSLILIHFLKGSYSSFKRKLFTFSQEEMIKIRLKIS